MFMQDTRDELTKITEELKEFHFVDADDRYVVGYVLTLEDIPAVIDKFNRLFQTAFSKRYTTPKRVFGTRG